MNPYTAQMIARQRVEETARNAQYAYHLPRSERRRQFPHVGWRLHRHPRVASA